MPFIIISVVNGPYFELITCPCLNVDGVSKVSSRTIIAAASEPRSIRKRLPCRINQCKRLIVYGAAVWVVACRRLECSSVVPCVVDNKDEIIIDICRTGESNISRTICQFTNRLNRRALCALAEQGHRIIQSNHIKSNPKLHAN